MGGITPVLSTVGGLVSAGTELARSRDAEKQQQREIERQKAEIKKEQEAYSDDRRDRLKRAAAAQRARFAAGGVSSSGSGSAVLLGLSQETDEEIHRRASLNALKNQALNDRSSSLYKRSLLDTADLFSKIKF